MRFIAKISIHAPLRERRCAILYDISLFQFQSTLPCGSDLTDADIARLGEIISIHAPLRERRGHVFNISIRRTNFNPRSLAGATVDFILPSLIIVFQSTLPCGSDAGRCSALPAVPNFNPRSLAGATCAFSAGCQPVPAFQSTLPCGSDGDKQEMYEDVYKFQSTLPCGSDLMPFCFPACLPQISIHAPLRERLSSLGITDQSCRAFQSTLPCGSDPLPSLKICSYCLFQSTLPCGSDRATEVRKYAACLFQSTLPCGSDVMTLTTSNQLIVNFNPRSLAGATQYSANHEQDHHDFNPRSLAGATPLLSMMLYTR